MRRLRRWLLSDDLIVDFLPTLELAELNQRAQILAASYDAEYNIAKDRDRNSCSRDRLESYHTRIHRTEDVRCEWREEIII